MAGRGRELTLPAWMKKQQQEGGPAQPPPPSRGAYPPPRRVRVPPPHHQPQRMPPSAPSQFADAPEASNGSSKPTDPTDDRRRSSHRSHRSRSRSSHRRDRSRSKERRSSRHRSSRDRRSRTPLFQTQSQPLALIDAHSPSPQESNFDVRPPGVTEENAAAYAAQAILQQNMAALSGPVGPASFGAPQNATPTALPTARRDTTADTMSLCVRCPLSVRRGAWQLYNVLEWRWNAPPAPMPTYTHSHPGPGYGFSSGMSQQRATLADCMLAVSVRFEPEITAFFNDVIDRALGEKQEGGSVVSVYINRERHFAFVELRSIELTTACMNLDGVSYNGQPLKIRRPNDYNPATVPKDLGPIPQLNLAALGIVSTTVSDGPGKIFIGGLPYHLNEEQVKELLQAFGPLRSFHLYMDINVTDAACLGLNDMRLGDKTLTVRRAMSQENAKAVASAAGTVNTGLEMGLDPSLAAMQAMSMAGIPSVPLGTPSRVVVLLNMVTPEELEDEEEYADIVDDIKGECERFGAVPSLLLPRPRDGVPSAVGKVYVEFGDVQSAQAAATELHGRGFSNRTVAVEYMDEGKYARRELA
ncbi:Nucleotide-binding alpha-beta plait domain [Phytophthora cactorum]|nr:Nucleotide-binding alpha-beta plait domain [Phytophthora cactorum]